VLGGFFRLAELARVGVLHRPPLRTSDDASVSENAFAQKRNFPRSQQGISNMAVVIDWNKTGAETGHVSTLSACRGFLTT
jgi:hypothetical protein